jgi:hypothetical protein
VGRSRGRRNRARATRAGPGLEGCGGLPGVVGRPIFQKPLREKRNVLLRFAPPYPPRHDFERAKLRAPPDRLLRRPRGCSSLRADRAAAWRRVAAGAVGCWLLAVGSYRVGASAERGSASGPGEALRARRRVAQGRGRGGGGRTESPKRPAAGTTPDLATRGELRASVCWRARQRSGSGQRATKEPLDEAAEVEPVAGPEVSPLLCVDRHYRRASRQGFAGRQRWVSTARRRAPPLSDSEHDWAPARRRAGDCERSRARDAEAMRRGTRRRPTAAQERGGAGSSAASSWSESVQWHLSGSGCALAGRAARAEVRAGGAWARLCEPPRSPAGARRGRRAEGGAGAAERAKPDARRSLRSLAGGGVIEAAGAEPGASLGRCARLRHS